MDIRLIQGLKVFSLKLTRKPVLDPSPHSLCALWLLSSNEQDFLPEIAREFSAVFIEYLLCLEVSSFISILEKRQKKREVPCL